MKNIRTIVFVGNGFFYYFACKTESITVMVMQNITAAIRRHWPVSETSLNELFGKMQRLELPRKHLLTRGGELSRHVYFIEKGFARSYILHNGKDITIWFSREGDMTFAMNSLYHNKPGYEYVELLEDSVLYVIGIEELNRLYETHHDIANWSRVAHQECLLYMDRHHNNRLFLTAKERYLVLVKEQPDLFLRANLGYIASYLGVSRQHLSRLRADKSLF